MLLGVAILRTIDRRNTLAVPGISRHKFTQVQPPMGWVTALRLFGWIISGSESTVTFRDRATWRVGRQLTARVSALQLASASSGLLERFCSSCRALASTVYTWYDDGLFSE